jgi:adenylyltransferase/sulfurtransferase
MMTTTELQQRLSELEKERRGLLLLLSARHQQELQYQRELLQLDPFERCDDVDNDWTCRHPLLRNDQVERYSRPVLAGLGAQGQAALLNSRVLVVGAGGIGNPCLLYLAGAGIGRLGVVDSDRVEVSNLHRQIAFTGAQIDQSKAESARDAALALNPTIDCVAHNLELNHDNALEIIGGYHVVVDASDNPKTRYLINDACSLLAKERIRKYRGFDRRYPSSTEPKKTIPVVFGSAVSTEAQITVFVHGSTVGDQLYEKHGCYRCLYPDPSAFVTASCASCSDAGVLGPVPGIVGTLQAMEVIKLLAKIGQPLTDHMLHYDALSARFFRIQKPPWRRDCPLCGSSSVERHPHNNDEASSPAPPSTTFRIACLEDSKRNLQVVRGPNSSATATAVCPAVPKTSSLSTLRVRNISPREYHDMRTKERSVDDEHTTLRHRHILLDVRDKIQYDLCHLPESVNAPLRDLPRLLDGQALRGPNGTTHDLEDALAALCGDDDDNDSDGDADREPEPQPPSGPLSSADIYCICRRGIASASAAALLAERLILGTDRPLSWEAGSGGGDGQLYAEVRVWNILGGLDAWREQVDPAFPEY